MGQGKGRHYGQGKPNRGGELAGPKLDQSSDHIQKTWGDGSEQGDLSLGWTIAGILSIPSTYDKQTLLIYLEPYSMLSRKGWFPLSGTKEEKHKAKTQERQQKKTGSCVLILWKIARAVTAPAEKARATIPRPVDLKAELRTGLEDF